MHVARVPLLAIALFIASPASAGLFDPKLKVNRIVPPSDPVSGIKRIEVAQFSGFNGDEIQSSIRAALLSDVRGDYNSKEPTLNEGLHTNIFEVVTSGGDAKLSGSTEVKEEMEDYKAKQAKTDSKGNVVKDGDGKTVYEEVSCKRRNITASVQWSLTGGGGAVLVQQTLARSGSDSKCGDDLKNLESKDKLATSSLAGVGTSVANAIAPRWDVYVVDIERHKSVLDAFKLAKDGSWELAICGFRGVLSSEPYNVDALYDLGALLELSGYYAASAEQYGKGVAVNGDKRSVAGVARVNARQAQMAVFTGTMGLAYQEPAPDYSNCSAATTSRQVEVKKETSLLSAPEAGSPPIAKLPKGMRLSVLDESGSLLKVVTGDGTEGWVDPKSVK